MPISIKNVYIQNYSHQMLVYNSVHIDYIELPTNRINLTEWN